MVLAASATARSACAGMTHSTTMTDARRLYHSELYSRWGPTNIAPAEPWWAPNNPAFDSRPRRPQQRGYCRRS